MARHGIDWKPVPQQVAPAIQVGPVQREEKIPVRPELSQVWKQTIMVTLLHSHPTQLIKCPHSENDFTTEKRNKKTNSFVEVTSFRLRCSQVECRQGLFAVTKK